MSRAAIDMAAVREGRAELAALVAEHPELASPEAQARLTAHLADTKALTPDAVASSLADMAASSRHAVNIRLEETLLSALDAAAEAVPVLSRHALCRAALHIGLAAIVQDPAVVLKQPVGAPQPMPVRAAKRKRKRPSK
ncbi:MAG: hypothetical protein RL685_6393 [Pseudomonadota bacterium]|jgi:hypothetical protein